MSSEFSFEDKGKVNPKPSKEAENPQKDEGPITLAEMKGPLDANKLTRMQNTLGNAAVQRFLAQRSGDGPSEIDEGTSQAINAELGGGQSLDEGIAEKAGNVMGITQVIIIKKKEIIAPGIFQADVGGRTSFQGAAFVTEV